jgi:DNA-binding PadR family transcriptional regulator
MDATGLASGTVYPILRRLEEAGMLSAKWERAADAHDEQRPPRRYYQITGAGRQALRDATARFPGLTGVLAPTAPTAT